MTKKQFKALDKHLIKISGESPFNGLGEEYFANFLVHAVLLNNEYDPKKIKKSMNKEISEMSKSNRLLPHYKEMRDAFFAPLEDMPLFVNAYFLMITKWRLNNCV